MGLLARYLEQQGLPTVMLANMRPHVQRVRPPRVLWVPFARGQTTGPAGDSDRQTAVVRAALRLLEQAGQPGATVTFEGA